jgi:hypothetical protein
MNKHIKPHGTAKVSRIQIVLPPRRSSTPKSDAGGNGKRLKSYAEFIKGIDRCSTAMKALEGEYRSRLNSILADLYGYARDISENKDWWSEFCRDPLWQGKTPPANDSGTALRYVIKLACLPNRESQKSASLYYRALKGFWSRKVLREKIESEIASNGGLRALADKNVKMRKPVKEKPANAVSAVVRSPSIIDGSREKPADAKKHMAAHTLFAKFNGGFDEWKRLKNGTRISMEMTLDEMGGSAAQITVHEVTVL